MCRRMRRPHRQMRCSRRQMRRPRRQMRRSRRQMRRRMRRPRRQMRRSRRQMRRSRRQMRRPRRQMRCPRHQSCRVIMAPIWWLNTPVSRHSSFNYWRVNMNSFDMAKRHACSLCYKAFGRKYDLKRHENQSINQSIILFFHNCNIQYLQKKIWLLQQCGGELENKPKACLVPDSLIKRLNFYII